MRTMNRRQALHLLAACTAATAGAPILRALPCAAADLPSVQEERLLLGTIVGITAVAPSAHQAQEAIDAAFATINRLDGVLSRYNPATPLSALNAHGQLRDIPTELQTVMEYGLELHKATAGRFDMTIAPVLDLLERAQGNPDPADLREALALVDSGRIRMASGHIALAHDMAITLDGVAKGYIADAAAQTLRAHGIAHFLVDAGGDIRVQGSPEGRVSGRPWIIAIEDPDKGGHYPTTIAMRDGAVATSGGYEHPVSSKIHHLLDPRSGRSPQHVRSVSVVAPTVMQADGLATALSLMPPREALRLAASLPGCACFLVTASGGHLASPGWPA
ncbi:MAG: ApbE family lipoprotein [Desulfomicrobiaceae bacterium]|jgi:thiamine biosynthesis lipoprotein|nr:FAD:protein FMN transferase [Desulfomicrobiaceae bacterium]MBZ4685500.1 ApbE family lipoprotein [Desulfomicrobiaceae bacterium]MDI3492780.1 FAD:protein transferase [Desulfomicrobiaceae bacterium]